MVQLRLPMAIIVSSGGLRLLIVGSLLVISSAAQSSETHQSNDQQAKLSQEDNSLVSSYSLPVTSSEPLHDTSGNSTTPRKRFARFFNHQDSATYGNQRSQSETQQQQQERSMSMESYAAALAAANSVDNSNGSADLVQSTIPANDAASFGEQPAPSPVSTSRQFEATEYSPVHASTGSSYYASVPSASNYLPNHLGHSSSGASYQQHYHHQHPHNPHSSQSAYHYQSSPAAHNYQQQHHQHYGAASKKVAASLPPIGYPSHDYWSSPGYFADRSGTYPPMPYWSSPHTSSSSGFGGSLMSGASSALSHWTGGFGVAEIICGIIALSIGAVILGAPFFLIYLALMGNFSGSSTLSLTNPTQGGLTNGGPGGSGTTTVNGRRKRLAIYEPAINSTGDIDQPQVQFSALADTVISQLSPFVDIQQVTATFRKLVDSIEKYSKMNQRPNPKTTTSSSPKENKNRLGLSSQL